MHAGYRWRATLPSPSLGVEIMYGELGREWPPYLPPAQRSTGGTTCTSIHRLDQADTICQQSICTMTSRRSDPRTSNTHEHTNTLMCSSPVRIQGTSAYGPLDTSSSLAKYIRHGSDFRLHDHSNNLTLPHHRGVFLSHSPKEARGPECGIHTGRVHETGMVPSRNE